MYPRKLRPSPGSIRPGGYLSLIGGRSSYDRAGVLRCTARQSQDKHQEDRRPPNHEAHSSAGAAGRGTWRWLHPSTHPWGRAAYVLGRNGIEQLKRLLNISVAGLELRIVLCEHACIEVTQGKARVHDGHSAATDWLTSFDTRPGSAAGGLQALRTKMSPSRNNAVLCMLVYPSATRRILDDCVHSSTIWRYWQEGLRAVCACN
jgi:hypothetical protein